MSLATHLVFRRISRITLWPSKMVATWLEMEEPGTVGKRIAVISFDWTRLGCGSEMLDSHFASCCVDLTDCWPFQRRQHAFSSFQKPSSSPQWSVASICMYRAPMLSNLTDIPCFPVCSAQHWSGSGMKVSAHRALNTGDATDYVLEKDGMFGMFVLGSWLA